MLRFPQSRKPQNYLVQDSCINSFPVHSFLTVIRKLLIPGNSDLLSITDNVEVSSKGLSPFVLNMIYKHCRSTVF